MRFLKGSMGALIAAVAVLTGACMDTGPSAPTSAFHGWGEVHDDGCLLPTPGTTCAPVAGVRLEVMDGKEKGRVAISDSLGRFDLGMLTVEPTACFITCSEDSVEVTATKDGWVSGSGRLGPGRVGVATIRIGQEPHVLWGRVYLPGTVPRPPVAGARVEILDGPNAGRVALTNAEGMYWFSDLVSSPLFHVEFSKDGYQTDRMTHFYGLRTNGSADWVLVAK
jgi:ribosomal protein S28E/S33